MEEGAGWEVGGVEAWFPGWVGPTGGADEEVRRCRGEGGGGNGFGGARQTDLESARDGVRRVGGERWMEGLGRLVGVEPTTSAATERRSATEL